MFSDDQPLFESAQGAENQVAGDEQTPAAQGPNNDQFIQGWDSLSPSSVCFHQASEQAAQSVGSFIRRPMDLPPPTQVGQGVHTPGISRASPALSSVLDEFVREPIPVQPVQSSDIIGGVGDLSFPAIGDVRGANGPDPDTQAQQAQNSKVVQANSTQVASPQIYSSDLPIPNGPQRQDVGMGERSPVPSCEQVLQAQIASLQAQLAAATAASNAGHAGSPMGDAGAPPPPPPPLRQGDFSLGTGVPPVVSGSGAHPAAAGGGHPRPSSTSMAEIWSCADDGQQAMGYIGSSVSSASVASIIVTLCLLLPVDTFAPGYTFWMRNPTAGLPVFAITFKQVYPDLYQRIVNVHGFSHRHRVSARGARDHRGAVWHVRQADTPCLRVSSHAIHMVLRWVSSGRPPQHDAVGVCSVSLEPASGVEKLAPNAKPSQCDR